VPRPKQRTPALREHVLEVALALLAAEGVQGFTARKVASTAGTSTPAVYELFGDKGGLVREVFFHGFELLGARLERLGNPAIRARTWSPLSRPSGGSSGPTRCSRRSCSPGR
jgi:AcrR family transcriptional regulator